jgi:tetratricopeptide (TPR) repeat protein
VTRAVWLLLILIGTNTAAAQVVVRRPRLRAGEDSNDATAYVRHARRLLYLPTDSAHAAAEAALIWAGRLDPGSGDPPYLLAVAVFRPMLVEAFRSGRLSKRLLRRELTPERMRYVDSLMRQAWLREPFYDIDLEPLLTMGMIPPADGLRDPVQRGYAAYQARNSQLAVDAWGQAIARTPDRIDLRLHRAHTFYWMRQYDSTVAELRAALASSTSPDSEVSTFLPPTYVLEYALAVAHERAGRSDSAKDAYRRALAGNLGLYMARVRLSNIIFAEGDTVQAMSEMALAADIAPREPWLLSYHGYLLLQAGRPADAVIELRNAIGLDSAYSTPYFLLGMAHGALTQDAEALSSFEQFLDRSPRSDDRRRWTMQRVSTLRAALSRSVGPRE